MDEMDEFWKAYIHRGIGNTAEDKREMLKQLNFNEFIDPNNSEEFYEYLNRIFSSFTSHMRERISRAYKQGREMGRMNTLSNNQRMILKHEEKYGKFSEAVDSTEGPTSGDMNGFEESFMGAVDRKIDTDQNN